MKRPTPVAGSVLGQVLTLLGALVVIWGVIAIYARQEYQRSLNDAKNQTANLAWAFEETVSRSIAVLDQTLQHARDLYVLDPDHFTLANWLRDKEVLRGISVQMAIADTAGRMTTTTVASPPREVSIADRRHFLIHVNSADDRLFISEPVIGRASGRLSIQFSRRIAKPDGSFAGVLVASLDPNVLGLFRESSEVDRGYAMLIGSDGIVRAARPDASLIGTSALPPPSPEMAGMLDGGPSPRETATAIGADGIVSYRAVTGYPLFVAVGVSRAAAFASYEQAVRDVGLAGLWLTAIVLVAGFMMIRKWHRLTRFHRALSMTLDNISQGILMIDARRRMPVVNRRVAELLGLPKQLASQGADFDAMMEWQVRHGEIRPEATGDRCIPTTVVEGGIDGNMTFYERTRPDGTVLEVRTTVLPDESAVRTFTDVTERKRIERELAHARDAAEAGIRARTEFLGIMGHEIRTPMNGIVGATGLLQQMNLSVEQLEYVRIVRESCEHLSSLIQNILDFSRLDSGALELEDVEFDLRDTVQNTVAMLNGQARAKGLTLTGYIVDGVPRKVIGDPARLRQILVNLIGNGIKFTESGGVAVDAQIMSLGDATVTIGVSVSDTGIGIDAESVPRLFSAFSQVDGSTSRRFGGTGLGLAICKHLVTLMGGTIDVASTPGNGSTFRFTMQLARVAVTEREQRSGQPTSVGSRHLKVLLAEDNPTNRHVAMRMLTRMGHEVDAVEDGARAVSAAAAADYDVVLMDIMMPEVDGIAAARSIRAGTAPRRDTFIIGLTANAMPSDRAACMEAGMNDFVTKPVTMDRLRAVLEKAAARKRPPDRAQSVDTETFDPAFLTQLADEISSEGVVQMIRIFQEDAPLHLVAIRRAMAEGALVSIRRETHGLAGAARTVGLIRLANGAMALHKACEWTGPTGEEVEMVAAMLRESLPLTAAWADARDQPEASAA